jgi:hypothetical protein
MSEIEQQSSRRWPARGAACVHSIGQIVAIEPQIEPENPAWRSGTHFAKMPSHR